MSRKSKTITLIKEKSIFAAIQYMFLKKVAKLIAPIFFRLNRPLPHSYQFYFITYHTTGHNAMMNFLQNCGVSVNVNFLENGLQRYVQNYARLSTYPTHATLAICEYNFKDFVKYTRTLNAKVPALILVRDPISMLKSNINFIVPTKENIQLAGGGAEQTF